MQATEIQEHARKLFEAHGPKALAEAAAKVRTLEQRGDSAQAADWRRIELALRHLAGPRAT